MPVYGLPLSLEASLNSLVELRPPTSWRVSGHGNEITVVLRWSLCGSPSSDKTVDYDAQCAKSSTGVDKSAWGRTQRVPQTFSPVTDIKTRCSSARASRASKISPKLENGFQPLKIRKIEKLLPSQMSQSPPIPIFITSSASAFSLPASESHVSKTAGSGSQNNDKSSASQSQCREVACSYHDSGCEDSNAQDADFALRPSSTNADASSSTDHELRTGILAYLEHQGAAENSSPNPVTLDEKSGLFKVQSKSNDTTLSQNTQTSDGGSSNSRSHRDSISLSEFASTSISLDTQPPSPINSQDEFFSQSGRNSRANTGRNSSTSGVSEASRTNASASPFTLISRSSRTKRKSSESSVSSPVFDSDKEDMQTNDVTKAVSETAILSRSPSHDLDTVFTNETTVTQEKEELSMPNDLDMVCSNVTEEINDADSVSSSGQSSHSYWGTVDQLPIFGGVPNHQDTRACEKRAHEDGTETM